jgi:acyl carrier protein
MTEQEFLRSMDELFEVPAGTLTMSHKFRDLDNWDSLKLLTLIALLDEKYGVILDVERFASGKTLADIFAIIEAAKRSD